MKLKREQKIRPDLEVGMFDLQHVGDVERPVLSAGCLFHGLDIDVPSRGHQHQAATILGEHECRVSNLAAWQQEVVLRADGICAEVIDLQQVQTHVC